MIRGLVRRLGAVTWDSLAMLALVGGPFVLPIKPGRAPRGRPPGTAAGRQSDDEAPAAHRGHQPAGGDKRREVAA